MNTEVMSVESTLLACQEFFMQAIDNMRDLAYSEDRALTMSEIVRRQTCEAMIARIDDAIATLAGLSSSAPRVASEL